MDATQPLEQFLRSSDDSAEVKIELCDDSAPLKRSANGLIELFLHSCGNSGTIPRSGTLPRRGQTDYVHDIDFLDKPGRRRSLVNLDLLDASESTHPASSVGGTIVSRFLLRRHPHFTNRYALWVTTTMAEKCEDENHGRSGSERHMFLARLAPLLRADGAVAKDGRIEVGDQIVQVNNRSFENLTEAQAVRLLREVAAAKKPLTLFVAKYSRGNDYDPLSTLASETLPLDVSLWVQTAVQCAERQRIYRERGIPDDLTQTFDENALDNGEETDDEEERALYEQRRHGIPQINIEELERRRENEQNVMSEEQVHVALLHGQGPHFAEHKATQRLSITMDPVIILRALARPDSGLQVKNRKWLKILVPMSFIGRDLVDWLLEHVEDLSDRKAARQYAAELLRAGLIRHVERALYEQRRHGIPQINIEELERRRENEQNVMSEEQVHVALLHGQGPHFAEHKATQRLSITMDPVIILRALARPDSGLQVKNRKWLKILVPMSFIGRDLVDWLLEHVEDLSDRKAARQYAAELLRAGLIRHVVSKLTFTEKCYYVFGDAIVGARGGADSTQNSGGTMKVEATTEVTYVGSPAPTGAHHGNVVRPYVPQPSGPNQVADQTWPFSPITTNDYASMVGGESSTSYARGVDRGIPRVLNTPVDGTSDMQSNLAPPHPSPCETVFEDDDKRRILRR
ncbi:domain found in Dishevelled, Egl-10, and Pleckstrin [Ancylostoma ceylanicum]|uniref:Domain found in Dishevelled, Egl-10, and Pleckstrin n=1 Tax=Ancylostoma ceylanicum TaxID=53326 RepID=A0A0D6LLG2_9BILA|nr:domain found in Dishevelled, Egl-10, and Pleckstrin [Ancylostoma ceylanicum]